MWLLAVGSGRDGCWTSLLYNSEAAEEARLGCGSPIGPATHRLPLQPTAILQSLIGTSAISHAAASSSASDRCSCRYAAVARVPAPKHVGFCTTIKLRIFTRVGSISPLIELRYSSPGWCFSFRSWPARFSNSWLACSHVADRSDALSCRVAPTAYPPRATVIAPALTSAIIERFMAGDRIRPGEAAHHWHLRVCSRRLGANRPTAWLPFSTRARTRCGPGLGPGAEGAEGLSPRGSPRSRGHLTAPTEPRSPRASPTARSDLPSSGSAPSRRT